MDFELRWVVQQDFVGISGPKILQYREKYDPTVKVQGHTNINVGRFNPYLEWSEWKDVPIVESN
jgi:hypothetical protein